MDVKIIKKPVIHIKYCGGCNPTFERKEVATRIERYFGFSVDPVNDSIVPDITLIVNGCKSECLFENDYNSRIKTILINDTESLDNIVEDIKKILRLEY